MTQKSLKNLLEDFSIKNKTQFINKFDCYTLLSNWEHEFQYRIKPNPKVRLYENIFENTSTDINKILEKQKFNKELYNNELFFQEISKAQQNLENMTKEIDNSGSVLKKNMELDRLPFYLNCLQFVANMIKSDQIKETKIIPTKEISDLMKKKEFKLAENLFNFYYSLTTEKVTEKITERRALQKDLKKIFGKNQTEDYLKQLLPDTRNKFCEIPSYSKKIANEFATLIEGFAYLLDDYLYYQTKELYGDEHKFEKRIDARIENIVKEAEQLRKNATHPHLEQSYKLINVRLNKIFYELLNDFSSRSETDGRLYALDTEIKKNSLLELNNYLKDSLAIISMMKYYEKEKGLPIVFPEIFPMNERQTEIKGNIHLHDGLFKENPQRNDIYHDPSQHSFFITGSEIHARSYFQQIGQVYLLSMNGFPLIGESAKISVIDKIKTEPYNNFCSKFIPDESLTQHSLILSEDEYPRENPKATESFLQYIEYKGITSYLFSYQTNIARKIKQQKFPKTKNLSTELKKIKKTEIIHQYTSKILR